MPTMDKQPPLSRNSTITSTSSQRSNPQSLNGDYQRRDSGIYKGISDRPLGWKRVSKRAAKASQQLGITAGEMKIRKWDGAARMSTDWDGLRRVCSLSLFSTLDQRSNKFVGSRSMVWAVG
jgi:hypothetical protein